MAVQLGIRWYIGKYSLLIMSRFDKELTSYTRRDFLKLSGTGLLSLCLLPAQKKFRGFFAKGLSDSAENTSLGRVTAREIILYEDPTTQSKMLEVLKKDTVVNITRVVSGENEPVYNQIWFEIDSEGFAHSGTIQPVQNILNTPVQDVLSSGSLAEVSVPFTDARWHPDNPYSHPLQTLSWLHFLGYQNIHCLKRDLLV